MLILVEEWDCPYNEKLVQRTFLHTIFTELGNNGVTAGLCHTFKVPDVSGEHLLQSNSEAVNVRE